MAFTVISHNFSRLSVGEVFDRLLANPVEFNPYAFIVFVNQTVCMATKTMHCTVGFRNTTITHYDGHLVNCFWQASPEVPVCCRIAKICLRIAFYSTVQVRELQWIADEEYWCIVTCKVPVTFFCVEFYSKTTDIAFRISRTTFACHCGETYE